MDLITPVLHKDNTGRDKLFTKNRKMKKFLSFVEIQTKTVTILPFLLALAYVFYTTGTINLLSTLIYIPAALLLDMSVTAANNYKNSRLESDEKHYSNKTSIAIIGLMSLVSAVLSIYLVCLHGLILLLAGAFCFAMGILYSFGPAPICKSAYGEVVAGFTIGTMIMFIVVSINDPAFAPLIVDFISQGTRLDISIDIFGLAYFVLLTLPATLSGANILLANNICDAEKDLPYRRTLVHNIGLKNALKLFVCLYAASYIAIFAAVLLRLIPPWSLLVFLTVFPVKKNIKRFFAKQVKSETFALSVINFAIIMICLTLCLFVGGLVR
jgi:1,4-dihydroxy-2-naphthoate octaprenyltransferase